MMLAALCLTLLLLALLWASMRRDDSIADRHSAELAHHQATLQRIATEERAGQVSASDAQSLTLDVQRRMLRLRPHKILTASPLARAPLLLLCAVAALCAAFGYWQFGNAALADRAAPPIPKSAAALDDFRAAKTTLEQNPAHVPAWIDLAMALQARGDSARAVETLGVASHHMPQSADLWVARGQALMMHGGGQLNPAARLAFDRASALDPKHPGPHLYLALAWLEAGQPQEALPLLEALAKDSPADAPWMPRVARMTRGARAMIAAGIGKE